VPGRGSIPPAGGQPWVQHPGPSGTAHSRLSPAMTGPKQRGQTHDPRALTHQKLNPSLLIRACFHLLFSSRTSQGLTVKYCSGSHSQCYKPILSGLLAGTGSLYTARWRGDAMRGLWHHAYPKCSPVRAWVISQAQLHLSRHRAWQALPPCACRGS